MAKVIVNTFELQAKGSHTFNDVPADTWRENAISEVQTNNIAVGIEENK